MACEYAKLENTHAVEHLVNLKIAYAAEIKQIVIDDWQDITFIKACKLYLCTSTIGSICDCK